MGTNDNVADDPISRFAKLGKRDREAIMQELSHEQRTLIERARRDLLAAEVLEAERQRRTDRQFHPYSQWLSSLIEQAENATPEPITKTAADALWDVHQTLHAAQGLEDPGGWKALFATLGDWLAPTEKKKA